MSAVEMLYVTSMLTWAVTAQATLWRLMRQGHPVPVARAVPAARPRTAGDRSA